MFRLAALDERIAEHLGIPRPLGPEIPDAVNSMKHDVDAGIAAGWNVRLEHVIHGAQTLWPLLAPGGSTHGRARRLTSAGSCQRADLWSTWRMRSNSLRFAGSARRAAASARIR
jgi:hypothetical protein